MVDSLLEIITATRSQKLYKPIEIYSVTNAIDEIGVSMFFLVVTFFCGYIKGRELFADRINKNHLDLFLGSHDRNCCTMENLR